MGRLNRRFAACVGLLGLTVPPAAAADATLIQTERLTLVTRGASARLEGVGERTRALHLPPGSELSALAETDGGWVAAGARVQADGGRSLLLLAGDRGVVRRLPAPPGQKGRWRLDPQPLVADGRLVGLAWLEGQDQRSLAVRAAGWGGSSWTRDSTVSLPGPGSQLALAATVLGDGSWLLVWSAFDGSDDEILWTRHMQGTWSAPRRLAPDNRVPDITPALAPLADGALAAWSRFDGNDYRLVVARYRDGGWSEPQPRGGPGSLFPSFTLDRGLTYLLFREPAGWSLVELDEDGQPLRRADLRSARRDRPAVAPADAEVAFRWPLAGRQAEVAWGPWP